MATVGFLSLAYMRKLTRLVIAISELGGGALLMGASAFASLTRIHFPAWYLLLIESLGVIALIAGYRLIQNRSQGFSLSLSLQVSQLFQFFLPKFLYRVILGPYLIIIFSADATLISPGFKGELTIGWKGPPSVAFGFNVVAAVMCFLLARAILAQRRVAHTQENRPEPGL